MGLGSEFIDLIWSFAADIYDATLFIFTDLTEIVNDCERGELVTYLFIKEAEK